MIDLKTDKLVISVKREKLKTQTGSINLYFLILKTQQKFGILSTFIDIKLCFNLIKMDIHLTVLEII